MNSRGDAEDVIECRTRHGTIAILRGDVPIARALERYGEWAQAEIDTLTALLGDGDVAVDVGAHVGIFTTAFARKVGPRGRVLAFEPQERLCQLIKTNVERNQLSCVEIHSAAVGTASGTAVLESVDYHREANFGAVSLNFGGSTRAAGGTRVTVIRLDDLKLSHCRLIKADVEGSELDVLEGAQQTLQKLRPIVSAEANTIEAAWALVERFQSLGLSTWLLATRAFNERNWQNDPQDMFCLAHEISVVGAGEEHASELVSAVADGAFLTPVRTIGDVARAYLGVPLPNDPHFQRASPHQIIRSLLAQKNDLSQLLRHKEERLVEQRRLESIVHMRWDSSGDKQNNVPKEIEQLALAATKLASRPMRNLRITLSYKIAKTLMRLPLPRKSRQYLKEAAVKNNPRRFKVGLERICAVADMARSGLFDVEWYLFKYPDIAERGLDPISHYVETGWREARDPNSWFSTSYYLMANPDVAQAGVNPFWHYVVSGRRDRREFAHPGGDEVKVLARMRPIQEQRQALAAAPGPPELQCAKLTPNEFANALLTLRRSSRLLVAFSHDDYRTVFGGTQRCLQVEEKAAQKQCVSYLNLHPTGPAPGLVAPEEAASYPVVAVLDGRVLGTLRAMDVLTAFEKTAREFTTQLIVHHLLGHAPEFVTALHRTACATAALFWAHDYFAACPSHALMRNGVSYCGAPPVHSMACRICVFGSERQTHVERMRVMLTSIPFSIIAPSESARRVWARSVGIAQEQIYVNPHCRLVANPALRNCTRRTGPARVAFIGCSALHKGWPVFKRLVHCFRADTRYRFLHLGMRSEMLTGVSFEEVSIARDGQNAMISAIERNDVDVALLWSVWPETFGFVAYEALAANTKLVVWEGAGNLPDLVRERKAGLVLDSEASLSEAFRDGRIFELACLLRRNSEPYQDLMFGDMSLDLLQSSAVVEVAE